jgi:hypothetical protein
MKKLSILRTLCLVALFLCDFVVIVELSHGYIIAFLGTRAEELEGSKPDPELVVYQSPADTFLVAI